MIWSVEVEQTVERTVTVEADTYQQARAMATRGPAAWLDSTGPVTVQVEAGVAICVEPIEDEVDAMQAWRERNELSGR